MAYNTQQMQYEPDTPTPIAIDWEGKDLFDGDHVVDIDGVYVLDDTRELVNYLRNYPRYILEDE